MRWWWYVRSIGPRPSRIAYTWRRHVTIYGKNNQVARASNELVLAGLLGQTCSREMAAQQRGVWPQAHCGKRCNHTQTGATNKAGLPHSWPLKCWKGTKSKGLMGAGMAAGHHTIAPVGEGEGRQLKGHNRPPPNGGGACLLGHVRCHGPAIPTIPAIPACLASGAGRIISLQCGGRPRWRSRRARGPHHQGALTRRPCWSVDGVWWRWGGGVGVGGAVASGCLCTVRW